MPYCALCLDHITPGHFHECSQPERKIVGTPGVFAHPFPQKSDEEVDEFLEKVDDVSHPLHYNRGRIEVIEFIEDQRLGYHLGQVVKYITRAGHKDSTKAVEDLEKARWYLTREIELRIAKKEKRIPCRPNDQKAT